MPYDASLTPHVSPLQAHPTPGGLKLEPSVRDHMSRFGLLPDSQTCNGRDKPCLPTCEYRCNTVQLPVTSNAHTSEAAATSPFGDAPPQLEPTKRNSFIRMSDIFKSSDNLATQATPSPATPSPKTPKRHSKKLSSINDPGALDWLQTPDTAREFQKEIDINEAQQVNSGRRPRPMAMSGNVINGRYVADNCRPPIRRRSSSLKPSHRASTHSKSSSFRRDSIVTGGHQPSSEAVRAQAPDIGEDLGDA